MNNFWLLTQFPLLQKKKRKQGRKTQNKRKNKGKRELLTGACVLVWEVQGIN